MATYRVEGYQGKKSSQTSFKVTVDADEKVISKYNNSNDKQKHFESIVKVNHFPQAEIVKVNYYGKIS